MDKKTQKLEGRVISIKRSRKDFVDFIIETEEGKKKVDFPYSGNASLDTIPLEIVLNNNRIIYRYDSFNGKEEGKSYRITIFEGPLKGHTYVDFKT